MVSQNELGAYRQLGGGHGRGREPWSVSLTSSPANSSRVQRARPSGGLEQAVATSRASPLPESLRLAPGRGASFSAASRLPNTKRCLVR